MVVAAPVAPSRSLGERFAIHSNVAKDAVREMKLIGFKNLLPYQDWVGDKPWNLAWARWLVAVALFPLFLNFAASTAGLTFQSIAFVFGVYFALMWGIVFYFMLQPKLEFLRIAEIFLFTTVCGIAVVLFIQQLPLINLLYAATESEWMPGRLIGFVCGVGVLEETAKIIPLWWIFMHRRNQDDLSTIVFLGCVSGFGFGVAEAAKYSISYALGLNNGQMGFGSYLTVQLLRLITLPLLHAIWCGIFSYFVALASMNGKLAKGLFLTGLMVVATLHGLYDTFSDSLIGVGMAVVSILIFVAYYRSGENLQAKLTSILAGQEQYSQDTGALV
jgi:RsiW-degrading membrane proteinase PrsW (M82 family)